MGVGTFFIGVLPGYATWGILAPIVLIGLRLVQGLALGGEYGGAAIYVAEHAPPNKRGYYTSWIQTTATLGLFMALLLILGIRTSMGEAAFGDWGWRIPFLLSAVLLAVSLWIRLKLNESPLFQRMVDEGKQSKRPLTEAFGQWQNCKIAIAALLGATAGEAVVWYGGQFYALFFLTQTLKVPGVTAQILIAPRASDRHALLHPVRRAVRPDRPEADHAGRLCARGRDLLPDLPGHHALRQSEAGSGAGGGPGDGHRRPERMRVPVQGDGNREVHHRLRQHQIRAGEPVGELQQRLGARRHQSERQDRRSDHRRRHAEPRRSDRRRGEEPRLSGRRRPERHQLHR